MIHPNTELRFISNEIGYGVVAKSFIPKGTITWVLDKLDREFTPQQIQDMDDLYKNILDIYAYRNREGNFVLCWDNARFVNHSFKSNCLTTAYDFEIAIRDIHPGEQLTDDYGYLNISEPFHAYPEGTKRTVVYPDDTLRYHKIWDQLLNDAFNLIPNIDQPLSSLISKDHWDKIHKICEGKMEMDSILTTYYDSSRNGQ